MHDIYQNDLFRIINPEKTVAFDLNHLNRDESKKVNSLLTTYKLWGERDAWGDERKLQFLTKDCENQLSGTLLEIVKSPSVQERFRPLFKAFYDNSKLADVLVAASVLKLLGYDKPSGNTICELLGDNYFFSSDFQRNSLTKELFSLNSGNIIPRSSILAKHGLTSFSDSRLLVDRLIKIATNAHERGRASSVFFEIYKSLVTYSILQPLLPEKGIRDALIRFYEAIKNLDSARNHPHFWLQYAIARLSYDGVDDLTKAKLYLDAAYAHAAKRRDYHTHHMDNVKARYLIKHATMLPEINSSMIEFLEGHAILLRESRTEQTSSAAYKVAKNYLLFYNAKKADLNENHKNIILKSSRDILEYSDKLNEHIKNEPSVIFCRRDLKSLIADIEIGLTRKANSP